jgi:phage shock protein E
MKNTVLLSVLLFLGMFSCKSDISAQQDLKNLESRIKKENGILVDVRSLEEWNSGHHPKAIHLDWNGSTFKTVSASWDTSRSYYLHCAGGGRSARAVDYLKSKGFNKVYNLGGYDDVKNLKLE